MLNICVVQFFYEHRSLVTINKLNRFDLIAQVVINCNRKLNYDRCPFIDL